MNFQTPDNKAHVRNQDGSKMSIGSKESTPRQKQQIHTNKQQKVCSGLSTLTCCLFKDFDKNLGANFGLDLYVIIIVSIV